MGKKMNAVLDRARGFLKNRRGNVAMMFGLCLVPVTVAAGVGLDYVRAVMIKSEMAEALDAAALAVGSSTGLDQAKALDLVQKYFNANYKGEYPATLKFTDTGYVSTGSVTLQADAVMKTALMKVVDIKEVKVSTTATVVWGQSKLWVALVLDNSGSMSKGDANGTKMEALQSASVELLGTLKKAASTDGDVKVSVVPFTQAVNVGTSNASATWLDWTDWEAPPSGYTPPSTLGPGDNCPFSNSGSYLFYCTSGPSNSAGTVSKIPSSGSYKGYICPGMGYGTDHHRRYFNGCWDSVATQTKTVTEVVTQPQQVQQTCSQKGSGTITCTNKNNYPKDVGNSSTNTTTTYANGYTSDSSSSDTTTTQTSSNSDGTKSCSGSGNNRTCTWTRSFNQNEVTTNVTKTAYNFTHTWKVNARSTWSGCVIDREKDSSSYDVKNVPPSTAKFSPGNLSSCLSSQVRPFGSSWTSSDWTAVETQINNMTPNGATNQTIGLVHGWQTLTNTSPYSPGALPANTARYIILFSDGLNTLNRWWGDGSTENTTEDGYIDDRLALACTNAKADGIVIYSVFLHIGTNGNSAPLEGCASDSTKYFDLTSTDQVSGTFNQIAQQITNVRVSR